MSRLIALLRAGLVALLMAAPLPVLAASYTDPVALDQLFAQLKVAPNADAASMITGQIWDLWFSPNVPALLDEMNKSALAMSTGDLKTSKAILDQVVTTYPDYAEGWNQRATIEYDIGDFADSLDDIAKTLAIEPRHFGALSGRVLIYLKQGKRGDALRDMFAALAIHPYLSEKLLFPELLQDQIHL